MALNAAESVRRRLLLVLAPVLLGEILALRSGVHPHRTVQFYGASYLVHFAQLVADRIEGACVFAARRVGLADRVVLLVAAQLSLVAAPVGCFSLFSYRLMRQAKTRPDAINGPWRSAAGSCCRARRLLQPLSISTGETSERKDLTFMSPLAGLSAPALTLVAATAIRPSERANPPDCRARFRLPK